MGQASDYQSQAEELLRQGRYEEALKAFDKSLQIEPYFLAFYYKAEALRHLIPIRNL